MLASNNALERTNSDRLDGASVLSSIERVEGRGASQPRGDSLPPRKRPRLEGSHSEVGAGPQAQIVSHFGASFRSPKQQHPTRTATHRNTNSSKPSGSALGISGSTTGTRDKSSALEYLRNLPPSSRVPQLKNKLSAEEIANRRRLASSDRLSHQFRRVSGTSDGTDRRKSGKQLLHRAPLDATQNKHSPKPHRNVAGLSSAAILNGHSGIEPHQERLEPNSAWPTSTASGAASSTRHDERNASLATSETCSVQNTGMDHQSTSSARDAVKEYEQTGRQEATDQTGSMAVVSSKTNPSEAQQSHRDRLGIPALMNASDTSNSHGEPATAPGGRLALNTSGPTAESLAKEDQRSEVRASTAPIYLSKEKDENNGNDVSQSVALAPSDPDVHNGDVEPDVATEASCSSRPAVSLTQRNAPPLSNGEVEPDVTNESPRSPKSAVPLTQRDTPSLDNNGAQTPLDGWPHTPAAQDPSEDLANGNGKGRERASSGLALEDPVENLPDSEQSAPTQEAAEEPVTLLELAGWAIANAPNERVSSKRAVELILAQGFPRYSTVRREWQGGVKAKLSGHFQRDSARSSDQGLAHYTFAPGQRKHFEYLLPGAAGAASSPSSSQHGTLHRHQQRPSDRDFRRLRDEYTASMDKNASKSDAPPSQAGTSDSDVVTTRSRRNRNQQRKAKKDATSTGDNTSKPPVARKSAKSLPKADVPQVVDNRHDRDKYGYSFDLSDAENPYDATDDEDTASYDAEIRWLNENPKFTRTSHVGLFDLRPDLHPDNYFDVDAKREEINARPKRSQLKQMRKDGTIPTWKPPLVDSFSLLMEEQGPATIIEGEAKPVTKPKSRNGAKPSKKSDKLSDPRQWRICNSVAEVFGMPEGTFPYIDGDGDLAFRDEDKADGESWKVAYHQGP